MSVLSTLPGIAADEGARRLALAHLEAAKLAGSRLAAASDAEALHDYRVALRRLRSCLRSYRRELRSTVTRRTLRELRRLARATSRSRDLDVHLAWLEERRGSAGEAERPGITWLSERLGESRRRSWEEMRATDEKLFPALHGRLRRQLSEFRTTIRLGPGSERRLTAAVAAGRARKAAGRLVDRLGRIQDASDEAEIHRARIAAKHLRYLLEPFADALPGGEAVIARLKGLQDAFGDVHDVHVFLPELRDALREAATAGLPGVAPGLRALVASLRTRGRQAFDAAAREWLGPGGGAFLAQVEALSGNLARLSRHGGEVERKFLLTGLPPLETAAASLEIEQGYLPGGRLVERLRRIRSPEGVELTRAVKEGSGVMRPEIEGMVEPEIFDQLWPLTEGRRLRKRRYRVPDGDQVWEIDEFLDRELVLAEIELPSVEAGVSIPAWLRPHVAREVTDEPAYGNYQLASSATNPASG